MMFLVLFSCDENNEISEVVLETIPEVIPVNDYFSLSIQLNGEKYQYIKASDIYIEAIMPNHGHGMNVEPIIMETNKLGHYLAKGLLCHMRGDWETILYINLGSNFDRISFDSTL